MKFQFIYGFIFLFEFSTTGVECNIDLAVAHSVTFGVTVLSGPDYKNSQKIHEGRLATSIEFDPVEGYLYLATNRGLYSSSIRGSDVQIHRIDAKRIVIDSKHALLFYSSNDYSQIGVMSLYGFDYTSVFNDTLSVPDILSLDVTNREIYWLNQVNKNIEKIVYDGSSRQVVVPFSQANCFVYSSIDERIYYGVNNTLRSCDKNGSGTDLLWIGGVKDTIMSIKLFQNNIYFIYHANVNTKLIKYDIKAGKIGAEILKLEKQNITDLAFLDSELEDVDENNCTIDYGDCTYFCLPLPDGEKTCIDPNGKQEVDIPKPTDLTLPPIETTLFIKEVPVTPVTPKTGQVVGDGSGCGEVRSTWIPWTVFTVLIIELSIINP